MSTRYIKRDNVRIIGLAKNASQAIKQVAYRNDNWELYNVGKDKQALAEFVNHYDKNVVVYFPIRDEMERAKSELTEWIVKLLFEKAEISKEKAAKKYDIKQLTEVIIEEHVEEIMGDLHYHPRFEYFKNDTMRIFLEEILFNKDWNGCRVRFFDLKKFSSHLPKYLGYDDTEIPYYNIATKNPIKRIILRHLTGEKWRKKRWTILTKEWQSYYSYISQPFWNGIKKSKYWIEL